MAVAIRRCVFSKLSSATAQTIVVRHAVSKSRRVCQPSGGGDQHMTGESP
jgi:hypothetical protein